MGVVGGVTQVSFNTVMAALKKGNQWRKSLELMEEMRAHGMEPDLVSFNTVMSVCGKAGKWQKVRSRGAGVVDREGCVLWCCCE